MGARWGKYPHDYTGLRAWILKGTSQSASGNRVRKFKEKRGTDAELYLEPAGEFIGIRYHYTVVAELFPEGQVKLFSGGYRTVTTKERMNEWLPRPFAVTQRKGEWKLYCGHVVDDEGHWRGQLLLPFEDGMEVTPHGEVRYVSGAVRTVEGLRLRFRPIPDDEIEVEHLTTGPDGVFMRFAGKLEVD